VPIYVTYLTARPDGDQLAVGRDPYGLDAAATSNLALNEK
jgi:murein L,D-transpeptidase YcbB/YkuD